MSTELGSTASTEMSEWLVYGTVPSAWGGAVAYLATGAGPIVPVSVYGAGHYDNSVAVTWDSTSGVASNDNPIQFDLLTSEEVQYVVVDDVYPPDDLVSDPWLLIDVTAPLPTPDQGDTVFIDAGDLSVAPSGVAGVTLSAYAADKLCDWIAGAAAPFGSRYAALLDTTGTEVVGGSYARQAITVGSPVAPRDLWRTLPSVTVRYLAVFDALTVGNEILRVQLGGDLVVPIDDGVSIVYVAATVEGAA